jgi:transcriptional regulator of acetoin/glycerol metabolism
VAARRARAAAGGARNWVSPEHVGYWFSTPRDRVPRYVLHLLERTQHNVSKAARLAGIDRNYLYRMMKKHGIARKE